MSNPVFYAQLVNRAVGCRSRTFVGPDEQQYVWKSKNNRLEVRITPIFPRPV